VESVDRKLIFDFMRELEAALRELLFAVSQGKPLPANAEGFDIVRAGLDNMRRLSHEFLR
jgi:hypothetical protein